MRHCFALAVLLCTGMTEVMANASSCPNKNYPLIIPGFLILKDNDPGYSIHEVASLYNETNVPHVPSLASNQYESLLVCETSQQGREGMLRNVQDSIVRSLNFIDGHIDQLSDVNIALALALVKAYDNRNGRFFQQHFPLSRWMSEVCNRSCDEEREFCQKLSSNWDVVYGDAVPLDVIYQEIVKLNNLGAIGKEKEALHGEHLRKCQLSLSNRCAADDDCGRDFFEAEPSSQYMLSHQLFHRMLAKTFECRALDSYKSAAAEARLCSKMFLESQVISHLNYPPPLRDIFSEHVALCSINGYQNFFRSDWLQNIQKWQSKSDYGCFIHGEGVHDIFITRRQTETEKQQGIEIKEVCGSHFTAISMVALTGFWDHLLKGC